MDKAIRIVNDNKVSVYKQEIKRLEHYASCLYDLALNFQSCNECKMRAVCTPNIPRGSDVCISYNIHYRSVAGNVRDDTWLRNEFGKANDLLREEVEVEHEDN